jgi:DNA ligase-associated metallophosphoesterase
MQTMRIFWNGEEWELSSGRTALHCSTRTLFAADLHLGKDSAFRRNGIAVPTGSDGSDLKRLSLLIEASGAQCVVILGDLFHAPEGMTEEMLRELSAWRSRHPSLPVTLVRGNHDRRSGDPPPALGFSVLPEPAGMHGLTLRHHPTEEPCVVTVAGHLHPAVRWGAGLTPYRRSACFWLQAKQMVLPAFGGFTGTSVVHPAPDDRVILAEDSCLVELPVGRKETVFGRR